MPVKRKKPGEEREGVAVASTSASSTGLLQRGKVVRVGLSLQAKRELLQQKAPQYRSASAAQKKEILNAFTRSTGYHRKYAMRLLNHPEEGQPAPAHPCPRQYGAEVQEVLVLAWEKMNGICAKRLIPFLPTFLEALEGNAHNLLGLSRCPLAQGSRHTGLAWYMLCASSQFSLLRACGHVWRKKHGTWVQAAL